MTVPPSASQLMLRRLPPYSRLLDGSISRNSRGSSPRRWSRRAAVTGWLLLAVGVQALAQEAQKDPVATGQVATENSAAVSPAVAVPTPTHPWQRIFQTGQPVFETPRKPWEKEKWLGGVEPPPAVLSLDEALNRARTINADLLLADVAVERQKAVQLQYRAQLLPRVNFSSSYDHRDESLKDISMSGTSSALISQLQAQTNNSFNTRFEAHQTVFSGLALINRYRQQVLRTRGAQISREDVRQRIDSMVKQNFSSVLYRKQVLAAREESVSVFTQAFEIAKAREKAGETTSLDLLRTQTELSSASAQVIEARTDLVQSEQGFRRLLRLPLPDDPEKDRLQLAGTLEEHQFPLSLEDTRRRALGLRHDYAAAKLQSDSAKRGVAAARGAYAPTIETFANYGWRSSYYSNNPDLLKGWTVGVAATMNIFDGFGRRGALRAEIADARTADLRLEELKFQILSQLGELFATLQQSRSALALHRTSVDLGLRGLEQASRMYKIGQIELEELINAQLALQRSRLGLARALLENNTTIAQLEYAGGEWQQ